MIVYFEPHSDTGTWIHIGFPLSLLTSRNFQCWSKMFNPMAIGFQWSPLNVQVKSIASYMIWHKILHTDAMHI